MKTSPESPESEVIAKVEEEEEVPMEVDGEEAAAKAAAAKANAPKSANCQYILHAVLVRNSY